MSQTFPPAVLLGSTLLVAAVSSLATALALGYARRMALLDQPGARRSHAVPTPRGGGVGIVVALMCGLAGLWFMAPEERGLWLGFGAGLLAVAGIGWLDDHRPLPILPRLAVHALAGLSLATGFSGWPGTPEDWAGMLATVIGVMTLVNIWNFMDGIDGLAASQAALVAIALMAIGGAGIDARAILALYLFAAAAAFLPFNFPRARIFLGDVGSGALGFAVAALMLVSITRGAMDWFYAPVLVSAFLIDAGLTLAKRILQGKRWWRPHREHLYQWAVRRGFGHPPVTIAYACWTAAAATVCLAGPSLFPDGAVAPACAFLAVGVAAWCGGRCRLLRMARESRA